MGLDALAEETEIRVQKLAVRELPRSGRSEQLLALHGLDAARIVTGGLELAQAA